MKSTSITKDVDSAGNHTFVLNMEGTVKGGWAGTVLMTMTAVTADNKTGTYTASSAAYLTDGSVITSSGSGVSLAIGGHKWQINGTVLLSDGTPLALEGELELASRSLNAKVFAIS